MLNVYKAIAQGRGLASLLRRYAVAVERDWDKRSRSRFDATDHASRHLGVFLPRGQMLRCGDIVVAAYRSLVRVLAGGAVADRRLAGRNQEQASALAAFERLHYQARLGRVAFVVGSIASTAT